MLSDDELFVVRALSTKYGDAWKEGEDPPDAYFIYQGSNIAVEISKIENKDISSAGVREWFKRKIGDYTGFFQLNGLF